MKRGVLGVITILVILLMVAAAYGPATTLAASPKTLKFGAILPLSGAGAPWGIGWLRGMEMATEEINTAGGIKVAGEVYQLKIVAEDDKYTGKGGVDAANRLIYEQGIKFINGPISSASALALQPITEKEKVLLLPDTYARDVVRPDKPYTFRIVTTSWEHMSAAYAWMLKEYPTIKTVFLTSPNDASGWSVTKDSKDAIAEQGLKIVGEQYYERGTTDFYPLITGMRATKPDVFDIGAAAPGDQALLVKQSREQGFKGVIIVGAGGGPWQVLEIAGKEYAEGFIASATIVENDPLTPPGFNQVHGKYMAKFPNEKWNPIIPVGYMSAYVFKMAVEGANSLDTTKVKEFLEKPGLEFDTVYGRASFGGKQKYGIAHQIVLPVFLGQVRDGKIVIVAREQPKVP